MPKYGENPAFDRYMETMQQQSREAYLKELEQKVKEAEAREAKEAAEKKEKEKKDRQKEDINSPITGLMIASLISTAFLPSVREAFFTGGLYDFIINAGAAAAFAFLLSCVVWLVIFLASSVISRIQNKYARRIIYVVLALAIYIPIILLIEKIS